MKEIGMEEYLWESDVYVFPNWESCDGRGTMLKLQEFESEFAIWRETSNLPDVLNSLFDMIQILIKGSSKLQLLCCSSIVYARFVFFGLRNQVATVCAKS